jgi:hypothetical protein
MNEPTIIQAIQNGKTNEAIQAFQQLHLSVAKRQSLSVIEASFHTLQQAVTKGTITYEQQQIELNRIHDRLLTLLEADSHSTTKKKQTWIFVLLFVGAVSFVAFYFLAKNSNECPVFDAQLTNKILLLPFENIGEEIAQPHLVLRDRIEQLSLKNQLSTDIQVGKIQIALSIREATQLAENCAANVVVWGKYSKTNDSLRVILQYHFLEQPSWSQFGELAVMKDVTAIKNGTLSKGLEDAVLSLCSVIALRQDEVDLAKRWLAKIDEKGAVDAEIKKVILETSN